ncbi:hypothetical protein L596_025255 [Steinernema carpocapsae]|uniref:Uncharacterized protein n=1 Tax=Steinernema carpocapsae TaxID=34508 RepID=A0A4U5M797_STECR|nr:hypothetical protein L596_025255 [Steinernema carpocapsae]
MIQKIQETAADPSIDGENSQIICPMEAETVGCSTNPITHPNQSPDFSDGSVEMRETDVIASQAPFKNKKNSPSQKPKQEDVELHHIFNGKACLRIDSTEPILIAYANKGDQDVMKMGHKMATVGRTLKPEIKPKPSFLMAKKEGKAKKKGTSSSDQGDDS